MPNHNLPVWPVWKQIESRDAEGLGVSAASTRTEQLASRTGGVG